MYTATAKEAGRGTGGQAYGLTHSRKTGGGERAAQKTEGPARDDEWANGTMRRRHGNDEDLEEAARQGGWRLPWHLPVTYHGAAELRRLRYAAGFLLRTIPAGGGTVSFTLLSLSKNLMDSYRPVVFVL